jgi:hypothetical protein
LSKFVPLLRGAYSVHDHCLPWLAAGPLGSCLGEPVSRNPDFSQRPNDPHLSAILPLFCDGSKDATIYHEALNTPWPLFAMIATPNQTMSTKTIVYCWPVQVSQGYLLLMSERQSKPLAILAHHCILLNMLNSFWFMEGCAASFVPMSAGAEWRLPHIQWPLSVVGVPNSEGVRWAIHQNRPPP